jgi:hypothetical protein
VYRRLYDYRFRGGGGDVVSLTDNMTDRDVGITVKQTDIIMTHALKDRYDEKLICKDDDRIVNGI